MLPGRPPGPLVFHLPIAHHQPSACEQPARLLDRQGLRCPAPSPLLQTGDHEHRGAQQGAGAPRRGSLAEILPAPRPLSPRHQVLHQRGCGPGRRCTGPVHQQPRQGALGVSSPDPPAPGRRRPVPEAPQPPQAALQPGLVVNAMGCCLVCIPTCVHAPQSPRVKLMPSRRTAFALAPTA